MSNKKDDKTAVGKALQAIWDAIVKVWNSINIEVIQDPKKRGVQIHIWIEGRRVTKNPVPQKEAQAILKAIEKGDHKALINNKNLRKRSRLAAMAKATPALKKQKEKA